MLHNVATVLRGTLAAQVIGVVFLPVLSRLYDPSDFGRYQLYTSSLTIFLMVVAFRYELALLTVDKGKDFRTLLAVVIGLCFCTAGTFGLIVLFAHDRIVHFIPNAADLLWFIPLAMVIAGIYQTTTFLPIRNQNYRLAASSKIVQSSGLVGVSIGLAFSAFSGFGLILGDLAGRIFAALQILRKSPDTGLSRWRSIPAADARKSLYQNRSYPLYVMPGTMLSAISAALVPFAFAHLFSLEVAGQYTLVERSIFIPLGMLAYATSQVYTGDLAQEIRSNPSQVHRTFRHLIAVLSIVVLPVGIAGWFAFPTLIPLVFGAEWKMAGEIARLAVPLAVVIFIASPVNMVLLVSGHRLLQLGWEVARFAIVALAYWVITHTNGVEPETVMITFTISGCVAYTTFLCLADRALARVSGKANALGAY